MIIVMKSTASKEDVEKVSGSVEKLGLRVNWNYWRYNKSRSRID